MMELINQLQNEVDRLRAENETLRNRPQKLEKENETLKNRVHFLEFQLDRVIREKTRVYKKYETLRKARLPKVIFVDPDRTLRGDYNALSERLENLLKENDILYENINKVEADNNQLRSDYKYAEDMVELYTAENELLKTELSELKQQMQQMRGKLISRDITINSYKDRERKPVIFEGTEPDLYQGEQKDMILELIENRMSSLEPYMRQYAVFKSILDANPEVGTRKTIRRKLYEILSGNFKGYHYLSREQKEELEELGFTFKITNTHARIIFHEDKRYSSTMAITASDVRAGQNTASDVARICL